LTGAVLERATPLTSSEVDDIFSNDYVKKLLY
jgi:hypothetical protein